MQSQLTSISISQTLFIFMCCTFNVLVQKEMTGQPIKTWNKCEIINIYLLGIETKWNHVPQAPESLNPNNMEFWMDDIYNPGYDALLRRKEADLRRAKICKLIALIATAVTIILIIVIPICTMGQ